MDDPLRQAKAKAAATYDAAADHFDDEPLAFWERIGRRTASVSPLPLALRYSTSAAGPARPRCPRRRRLDRVVL